MPQVPRKNRRQRIAIVVALALTAGTVAAIVGRHHVLPKRFATVEPGQFYRSGYNEPGPLKRVLAKHGIRTILCLADYGPETPKGRKERAVAGELDVDVLMIPMPGNGVAEFAKLDAAADIIADPAHRPLLAHCAAGVQRTNAAYVAYRMKHCGWSYEQAIAEAEAHWLDRDDNPELFEHLKQYADDLATRKTAPSTKPSMQ